MFEKIRKMKNKKGFTLVELIVVLVILAILAALLVPALTGYIDKANKQKIIAETRQAVMAAQTIASEQYAKHTTGTFSMNETTQVGKEATDTYAAEIKTLGELKGTVTDVDVNEKGQVTTLTLQNGKTCVYTATPATGEDQYKVS